MATCEKLRLRSKRCQAESPCQDHDGLPCLFLRPGLSQSGIMRFSFGDSFLIGERFARPHDSNSMVGKRMVHIGQLDLRHVTRAAVLCPNGACAAGMIFRGFEIWRCEMAA